MYTQSNHKRIRQALTWLTLLGLVLASFGLNLSDASAQTASVVSSRGQERTLLPIDAPLNDDFDAALSFSDLPFSHSEDISGATTAIDDPVFPCGTTNQGANSVWYVFTPPVSMTLTASSSGSTYDTVMALWKGTRGSLINVACNDDAQIGITSQISAILEAGVPYYLEISKYLSTGSAPEKAVRTSHSPSPNATADTLVLSVDFGCAAGANFPLFTTSDNENNAGTGSRDCDLDALVYNSYSIHPIEFNIQVPSISGVSTADLLLLNYDVDENAGEQDKVYINDHYAGNLVGTNDDWSTSVFPLDPAWLQAGDNLVRIEVDTTNIDKAVKTDWGQIRLNGQVDSATIRSASTELPEYVPGDAVSTTIEVDTNLPAQPLRTEVNLLNESGQIVSGTSMEHAVTGVVDDAITVSLDLPSDAPLGNYTVQILVYDLATSILQDSATLPFIVIAPNGQLRLPRDGVTLRYNMPTFDWNNIPGALGYTIQISKNDKFTLLVSNVNITGGTKSYYTPTKPLPAKTKLYWRVRGKMSATTYSPWSAVWSFTTANPPSVPALLLPANNALIPLSAPSVKLDWGNVTVPTGTTFKEYEVQMASNSAFTSNVSLTKVVQSQLTVPLAAPNSRVYWRVRAYNTLGQYSPWSAARYYRVAMLAPVSVAPGASAIPAEQLMTDRPTFTWDPTNGATSYTVEISRVENFSTKVLTGTATGTSFTPLVDLPVNTVLYWRVKANGPNGPSGYSQKLVFRTANPPSVPSLYLPAKGSLVTNNVQTLTWKPITAPTGAAFRWYELQIAPTNTFAGAVSITTTESDISNVQYTTDPLLNGTTYYWRVRSVNVNGEYSGWSAVWNFRVIYAPPANVNVTVGLKPVFTWDAVPGAVSYTIQLSKVNTFSSLLVNKTVTTPTYTQPTNLTAGTTYYWRIRVNGPYGPSLWTVGSFTTP